MSPTHTYHRSRACAKATNKRSEAGRRSRQLPARLITRIAARTGGDARARSASRTAVSPGREGMKPTASASTRKQPALAIRTLRRLRRGGNAGPHAPRRRGGPPKRPSRHAGGGGGPDARRDGEEANEGAASRGP